MKNGAVSFGKLLDVSKYRVMDLIEQISSIFGNEPNLFIVSGGKHSNKPISKIALENSLTKHGINNTYMIDAMIKYNQVVDFYLSIFFCDEKSNIKFSCSVDVDLEIAIEFWRISDCFMSLSYGFTVHNSQHDPILYTTGTHIYKMGFLDNLFNKQQINKEKYWTHNYSQAQNGLIRDIYKINLLNEKQLSRPIVGSTTLEEYIYSNDIGKLLSLKNGLKIWDLTKSDMNKIDELKRKCNENTIINSLNWKL